MKVYLDASVLVPYFIREATTAVVTTWVVSLTTPFVVSSFASGEYAAVVSRYLRSGLIDQTAADNRLEAHDRWTGQRAEVIVTEAADIANAARLVRQFDLRLRMPNAIHLATCRTNGFALATFDRALGRAAHAIGVTALAPA